MKKNRVGMLIEHTDKPVQDQFTEGLIWLATEDENNPYTGNANDKKFRRVEGVAARAGIVNRNNRLYSVAVFQKAVDVIQKDVEGNKFLGELEHPWETRSALERAAVKFTRVWMDGDLCKFEGIIMRTERGQKLEALLEAEVAVGISTRGYGTAKVQTIGKQDVEVINDDYRLTGIDFVLDPSNPSGIVTKFESIGEGKTLKTLEELKSEYPELCAELEANAKAEGATAKEAELTPIHEAAIESAKAEAVEAYKASDEAKKFENAFNKVMEAIAPNMPESMKLSESDLGKKVTELEGKVSELQTSLTGTEEKLTVAEGKLADVENAKAVAEALEAKLKGHKFESALRAPLADCKTVDEMNSKFDSLVAVLEKVSLGTDNTPAGSGKVEGNEEGKEGKDGQDQKPALSESDKRMRRLAGFTE